ncbi:protein of unknown function [Pseudomonas sp. JV551A1]|nr:protein of unknown function [Pseudomonas sp. JV551A1]
MNYAHSLLDDAERYSLAAYASAARDYRAVTLMNRGIKGFSIERIPSSNCASCRTPPNLTYCPSRSSQNIQASVSVHGQQQNRGATL